MKWLAQLIINPILLSLGAQIEVSARIIMAKLEELKTQIARLAAEIEQNNETVNKKLDELRAQTEDPTLQAEIDAITAVVSESADRLDTLQKTLYPPPPEPTPEG